MGLFPREYFPWGDSFPGGSYPRGNFLTEVLFRGENFLGFQLQVFEGESVRRVINREVKI